MKPLTEFIVALADLFEAEVESARRSAFALGATLILLLAGSLVALAAIGLLICALFAALRSGGLSPAAAALLCGLLAGLLATGLVGGALWLARKK